MIVNYNDFQKILNKERSKQVWGELDGLICEFQTLMNIKKEKFEFYLRSKKPFILQEKKQV